MGRDASTMLGLVLLAVAAAPVVAGRLLRRRRWLASLAGARVRELPTDPAHADHPSGPRTLEIRLGQVDGSVTWRPRAVDLLLGRNGLIVLGDVTVLLGLAFLAARADGPVAWHVVLACSALLPLLSLVLAVRALVDRTPPADLEPSRRDVVSAWIGWVVLAGVAMVTWLATAVVGLGLLLGGA